MKQLALPVGLLALTVATSSAARADDYAVVQFADGYCRIWWDSTGTPWGVGSTKIATGLPDHPAAQARHSDCATALPLSLPMAAPTPPSMFDCSRVGAGV